MDKIQECPECGHKLVIDEIINQFSTDTNIINKYYGHCPNCNKAYIWNDHYIYQYFSTNTDI